MVVRAQSSAAGVLALLSEPDPAFKQHALAALHPLVSQFWAEISEHIAPMHVFLFSPLPPPHNYFYAVKACTSPTNSQNLLAISLLCSLARSTTTWVNTTKPSHSLSAQAARSRQKLVITTRASTSKPSSVRLFSASHRHANKHAWPSSQSNRQIHSPALRGGPHGDQDRSPVTVHYRIHIPALYRRSRVQAGAFHTRPGLISCCSLYCLQAIGIALESRRFDVISRIYDLSRDVSLLSYAMEAVLDTGFSLLYRDQVLNFLLPLFPAPSSRTKSSHIHSLARLLVTLNNPSLTVPLLTSLVPKERLLAYQFAFDLAEGGTRDFLEGVRKHLPEGTEVGVPCLHDSDAFVTDLGNQETRNIFDKLRNILGGQESVKLYLEFLKRTNKVDMFILKNSKVIFHRA